jgi:hypothetical protein
MRHGAPCSCGVLGEHGLHSVPCLAIDEREVGPAIA